MKFCILDRERSCIRKFDTLDEAQRWLNKYDRLKQYHIVYDY
jgi:hypothetical protein